MTFALIPCCPDSRAICLHCMISAAFAELCALVCRCGCPRLRRNSDHSITAHLQMRETGLRKQPGGAAAQRPRPGHSSSTAVLITADIQRARGTQKPDRNGPHVSFAQLSVECDLQRSVPIQFRQCLCFVPARIIFSVAPQTRSLGRWKCHRAMTRPGVRQIPESRISGAHTPILRLLSNPPREGSRCSSDPDRRSM